MPERRLSPLAPWVWRASALGSTAVAVLAGSVLAMNVDALAPWGWLAPLVLGLLWTAVVPQLRWARWRWDVGEPGIDIQSGALTVARTLVPWVRVQHVDTRRGVLEQSFGLATVVVHTAAGSHTIPLLPQAEAESLRERIAGLARADDDGEPLSPAAQLSLLDDG
jgi:membrane protein YdbS with pleckstrin-like domain